MSEPRQTCVRAREALLEEPAPRGPLAEHLASCASCREVAQAHRAALALRAPSTEAGPMEAGPGPDPAQVMRAVARRRLARASAALALVTAVAAAAFGLAPPAGRRTLAADFSVLELAEEVESYTTRGATSDPLLSDHQAILAWLAPPSVPKAPYELPWETVTREGGVE